MADQADPQTEPITEPLTEDGSPRRRLLLQTQVNSDYLLALEAELVTVLLERFKASHARMLSPRLYTWSMMAIKYLSIMGFGVSLLSYFQGGTFVYSVRQDIILMPVFAVFCVVFWNTNKIIQKHAAMTARSWMWIAKKRSSGMLRQARKTLPFCAEYDFRDDVVAYYRITDKASVLAWTRTIRHWRVNGQYATLLFKKKTSMYPYVMILHEPSQELMQYMDALGIQPIPEA